MGTNAMAGTVPLLSGPRRFSFAAAAPPDPARLRAGEALVRVLAGGICGSDLPFFRGAPFPGQAVPGSAPAGFPMHEIVGEVVAVARDSPELISVGTRVVGWATRFDGMADYVVTDSASIAPCPGRWSAEEGVLIQPLACVLSAVERLGDITGHRCAVLGLGPIGLLFCHVLKDRGARSVTGVDPVDRSAVARVFGVDAFEWTTSAMWAASREAAAAPDVVIEAVGHQVSTLQHALQGVAPRGTVFYFGVNDDPVYPLDMTLMLRKHLTLMSGGTLDRVRMLTEAGAYLARYPHLVQRSLTHRFARSEAQRAYERAASWTPGRLKIVVTIAPESTT